MRTAQGMLFSLSDKAPLTTSDTLVTGLLSSSPAYRGARQQAKPRHPQAAAESGLVAENDII